MSLVLGTLSSVAGRGTLAFFTSHVVGSANAFSGGTVDIAGLLPNTGSTASVLTTTVFSWDTSGASGSGTSTNCTNINTQNSSLVDIQGQRMAPGHYCVAPIDIYNTNLTSLDAWLRLRLVRSTAVNAADTTEADLAAEALNDRLKFYMHEYTASGSAAPSSWVNAATTSAAAQAQAGAKAARDSDCTTANYKPTWTLATTGDPTRFNYVTATSSGQISTGTPPSGASGTGTVAGTTVNYSGASRTPLTSLGTLGRNLGAHPGVSAVKVSGSTGAYNAAQDAIALGLVNTTDETLVGAAASQNGLRLRAGTSSASSDPAGGGTATVTDAAPTEGNMNTTLGSNRNSYNVFGNDDITNPVTTVGGVNNGTNPGGTNAEATIDRGGRRFFCAAIFFPADTDESLSTVYSYTDSVGSAQGLGRTYATTYGTPTGNQYADCSAQAISSAGSPASGCATLGLANTALTAQNGKGDGAASAGNAKYYMVVSAKQKAGFTVP